MNKYNEQYNEEVYKKLTSEFIEDLHHIVPYEKKDTPEYDRTCARLRGVAYQMSQEKRIEKEYIATTESDTIEDVKEADYPADEYHKLEWENEELRNAIVKLTLEN